MKINNDPMSTKISYWNLKKRISTNLIRWKNSFHKIISIIQEKNSLFDKTSNIHQMNKIDIRHFSSFFLHLHSNRSMNCFHIYALQRSRKIGRFAYSYLFQLTSHARTMYTPYLPRIGHWYKKHNIQLQVKRTYCK